MIDDLQNFRLIEAGHGLGRLVVIDEHDTLSFWADQMVAGERADDAVVFIQNGIAAVAAFQHTLADVVDKVVEMEALEVLRAADAADGQRLIQQADGAVGIERRGDDDGVRRRIAELLVQLGLTDDDAAGVLLNGATHHVRLVAADDDAAAAGEQQIVTALRQGDAHVAADGIHKIARFVQNTALEHAEHIEQRNGVDVRMLDGLHVAGGDVAGGEHAEQCAVLICDGQGGDGRVRRQSSPRAADGHTGGKRRRCVIVEVAHLRAHGLDPDRGREAEAVEHELRLVADVAETGGAVLPVAECIAQRGVGHGGDDGVGIRIPMAGDVNGIHGQPPSAAQLRRRSFSIIVLSYPDFGVLSMSECGFFPFR